MNKQRLILILLGLIVAMGSAYGMFRWSGQLEAKSSIVVAVRNIKSAEEFGANNVQLVSLPERYILSAAVKDPNLLTGQKASADIYEGEQILLDRIGEEVNLKPSVNERLLFIPANNVVMKKGQKVDIYLLYTPGKSLYEGAERILAGKIVASAVNEEGRSVYGEKNNMGNQSGIEIILTHEEILLYLERQQYAKDVLVRHGEEAES